MAFNAYQDSDFNQKSWINVYMSNPWQGYNCQTFTILDPSDPHKKKVMNVGAKTIVFIATDDTTLHCNPDQRLRLFYDTGCTQPVEPEHRFVQEVDNKLHVYGIHDGFINHKDALNQEYWSFMVNQDDCDLNNVIYDQKKKA
ncbi:MAG: hypothetical protein Q9227_000570 [Pyrenula ochraceoflavens]